MKLEKKVSIITTCVKMNKYIKSAENFLLSCINNVAYSYDVTKNIWIKPYPEVTGYLLSYFANYHNVVPKKIIDAAQYLQTIQHSCGGYYSFDKVDVLYTFDTAQIMHGFISLYRKFDKKEYLNVAIKCADFIIRLQNEDGSINPMYDPNTSTIIKKGKGFYSSGVEFVIQTKNIEGFLLLYDVTNNDKYKYVADIIYKFSMNIKPIELTHPLGYYLEGLLAAQDYSRVKKHLEDVILRIKSNGFLSYSPELSYSYVSGSAQVAILLYKCDFKKDARKILDWLRLVQSNHSCGGLFQYANIDGTLNKDVHTEINSWGTKYFCELERLFI